MYPTTLFIFAILLGLAVMSIVCWGFRNVKESALPIAVFRIGFCFVLFMEVNELRKIRHLVFDEVPFLSHKVIDLEWMFVIWLVVIVFMGVGFCFRYAACISFGFSVATFGSFHHLEYHMDHAYMAVGFMFLILPVAKALSIDRVIERIRYGDMCAQPLVDGLCTKLLLFAGVGLVYFDSIFWKMQSVFWTGGLGTWLPGSIPSVVIADHSFLLDQSWLMYAIGYFTVIFEYVFVFTFWSRWFRWPLFMVGLGLHIGILVFFPIPWFALGVIGMYVLLIPGSFWLSIGRLFQRRQPKYVVRYDGSDPSILRTVVLLDILDLFNALEFESFVSENSEPETPRLMFTDLNGNEHSGIAATKKLKDITTLGKIIPQRCLVWVVQKYSVFQISPTPEWKALTRLAISFCLFIFVATQTFATYAAPGFGWFFKPQGNNEPTLINSAYETTGVAGILRSKESYKLYKQTANDTKYVVQIARTLFGVSYHGVFMDYHFDGLDHIVTVVHIDENGSETYLPLYQPDGTAGPINSGRIWVYWTFRIVGRNVRSEALAAGVEQITAFWCHENNIPLEGAKFRIKVKAIEKIKMTEWSEGFLKRQLQQPWVDAGTAQWENEEMSIELANIESMQPDQRLVEKQEE